MERVVGFIVVSIEFIFKCLSHKLFGLSIAGDEVRMEMPCFVAEKDVVEPVGLKYFLRHLSQVSQYHK